MADTSKQKRKRKGERPDGLIQVSLKIGYKPDGRPDRKYFYGHTRAEANRKRDLYKEQYITGSQFAPDITVREWVKIFKETYRTRVNKVYLKSDDVPYDRLVKKLGSRTVASIREKDLQDALNEVRGMSFSTADKYRQAMKRVFEKARKNKIIPDNPASDLIMPPNTKGTHRALEKWEVELILKHWNHPHTYSGLWILLMLLCGLRRGEMMALSWDNVDLEGRMLHVKEVAAVDGNQTIIEQRAKTDAGIRVLPICQILYDALASVPEEKRQGLVCLSSRGAQLSEHSARCGVKSFCTIVERIINDEPLRQYGRRTDIEKKKAVKEVKPAKRRQLYSFTAHDLRHTYATALYDAGVPVKAAQYFLGHADIRITLDLYTHLSRERESASRNQFVTYLDQWLDGRVLTALPFAQTDENRP